MPLVVTQDPAGKNIGAATWTYNIADGALDFLAEGEDLKLYYVAEVANNYALNNEKSYATFEITSSAPTTRRRSSRIRRSPRTEWSRTRRLTAPATSSPTGALVTFYRRRPHRYAHGLLCPEIFGPSANLPGFAEGVGTGVANIGTFALASVSEVPADANNDGSVGWTFTR